eukprot:2688685-Pleurochrysis_carterae.AAC.2
MASDLNAELEQKTGKAVEGPPGDCGLPNYDVSVPAPLAGQLCVALPHGAPRAGQAALSQGSCRHSVDLIWLHALSAMLRLLVAMVVVIVAMAAVGVSVAVVLVAGCSGSGNGGGDDGGGAAAGYGGGGGGSKEAGGGLLPLSCREPLLSFVTVCAGSVPPTNAYFAVFDGHGGMCSRSTFVESCTHTAKLVSHGLTCKLGRGVVRANARRGDVGATTRWWRLAPVSYTHLTLPTILLV